ncbi:MAG TPA: hypothetical protein VKB79_27345 [Bryobacteraceae bacterium]|nr:hypothetical protein [Bryobacteraceae bacterium]
MSRVVEQAPEELTRDRLIRLGEGIGKVVYGSPHWVVRRERSPREVVALIILWKLIRKRAHWLPFGWGKSLLNKPSRPIRFLRVVIHTSIALLPRKLWYTNHVAQVLKKYRFQDRRGDRLARLHLEDTGLLPETISFPPITVLVGGWPGWLVVNQATERVEQTLDKRISELAAAEEFDSVERWLDRFLETRQTGWRMGLFSVDAHLKNFGIIENRIVLLDTGGLTNRWNDIREKLSSDERVALPHVQLGLERALAAHPEVAARFNERWRSVVNRDTVIESWPGNPAR